MKTSKFTHLELIGLLQELLKETKLKPKIVNQLKNLENKRSFTRKEKRLITSLYKKINS